MPHSRVIAISPTKSAGRQQQRRTGMSDTERSKILTERLSNRQYSCLRAFTDNYNGLTVDECRMLDQRSFGSIYYQEFIRFDENRKRFVVTELGKYIKQLFEGTNIYKDYAGQFSHYLVAVKALNGLVRAAS